MSITSDTSSQYTPLLATLNSVWVTRKATNPKQLTNVEKTTPTATRFFSRRGFLIQRADDLDLIQKPALSIRHSHVLVRIPGASAEQVLAWESELNEQLRECGCSLGAKFASMTLLLLVLWQFIHPVWNIYHLCFWLLRTMGVAFAAGGVGKLLGLTWAKYKIRGIADEMRNYEAISRARRS